MAGKYKRRPWTKLTALDTDGVRHKMLLTGTVDPNDTLVPKYIYRPKCVEVTWFATLRSDDPRWPLSGATEKEMREKGLRVDEGDYIVTCIMCVAA